MLSPCGMRVLAVTVLTLSGCFGTTHDCYRPQSGGDAILTAVLGTAGFILDVAANSKRPEPAEVEAEPPPSGIRDTWRGPALACKQGRTFHLRCVTASSGRSCFWETDEGQPFDCPDEKCQTIPADLAAWCY
jgi:hypothetical protein